ncbi:MAG TPA: ABC transporter ATP-binding protein [Anaerolineales bacterium]|nr:ABC transporter ATP-binding protein [Anaerolineales bacterium]
MALLEMQDLSSGYGELQILWGANVRLESGKLTALIGSNGAGKTTLLRTMMGLVKPWGGSIKFEGYDVAPLSAHAKAHLGLVLVPEGRQLFTDMTVYENLELGATGPRGRPNFKRNLERVFDIFPRLKERQKQSAGTMSGGEQQMLAVARGVMAEPRILMFDELSLGLSPVLTLSLFETLGKLKAEGLTMLLVEQNVHMALAVSDYAFALSEGRITIEGEARALAQNPDVRKAYLGI